MPGTQPDPEGVELLPIVESMNCVLCHAAFEPPMNVEGEPFRNWAGSMMAQASRDPVFYAALTVANQDAGSGGDLCLRCHASAAWLGAFEKQRQIAEMIGRRLLGEDSEPAGPVQ